MAEITVHVCDVCMDPGRDVEEWKVVAPQGNYELTLCEEHAAPLVEVIGKVPPTRVAKKTVAKKAQNRAAPKSRRRSPNLQVRSLDEIESM